MSERKMTMAEMMEKVAVLEKKLAEQKSAEPGRIWPDVSKAVKEGEVKTSTIVLRGVNADPRRTVNLYPSQLARIVTQLPNITKAVLKPDLWDRFTFRSEEERKDVKAVFESYLGTKGETK